MREKIREITRERVIKDHYLDRYNKQKERNNLFKSLIFLGGIFLTPLSLIITLPIYFWSKKNNPIQKLKVTDEQYAEVKKKRTEFKLNDKIVKDKNKPKKIFIHKKSGKNVYFVDKAQLKRFNLFFKNNQNHPLENKEKIRKKIQESKEKSKNIFLNSFSNRIPKWQINKESVENFLKIVSASSGVLIKESELSENYKLVTLDDFEIKFNDKESKINEPSKLNNIYQQSRNEITCLKNTINQKDKVILEREKYLENLIKEVEINLDRRMMLGKTKNEIDAIDAINIILIRIILNYIKNDQKKTDTENYLPLENLIKEAEKMNLDRGMILEEIKNEIDEIKIILNHIKIYQNKTDTENYLPNFKP